MTKLFLWIYFFVFVGPSFNLVAGAIPEMSYVMCRSQKVVRTIRVSQTDQGCQATYTKSGIDKVVGSGKNRQTCLMVAQNIKNNLEGASWKCKDVSVSAGFDSLQ